MFDYELVYNSERFYTVLILLSAIILTSIIATYAQFRVRNREQRIEALLLNAIILIYQAGQFLAVVSPPKELAFFVSLQCIGFCLLGPAFYIYINALFKPHPPGFSRTLAVFSLSFAGIALVLTNSFHERFYTIYNIFYIRYGLFYIWVLILNFIYALSGCVLLLKNISHKEKHRLRRNALFPASLLIAAGAAIFDVVNPDMLSYDITPSSIAFIQLMFFFSNRLSGLSGNLPTGRRNILDCINESVIMTDMGGNVIYHNNTTFNRYINMENGVDIQFVLNQLTGMYASPEGLNSLREHITLSKTQDKDTTDTYYGEILLCNTEASYYSYSIRPIRKGTFHTAGILYIFRDVTEDKKLVNYLDARSKELAAVYDRTKKYSLMVKQLSVEKERDKILGKVSNDVEKAVLQIIALLEELGPVDDSNVLESIKVARSGIAGIRKSISTISASLIQEGEKMND